MDDLIRREDAQRITAELLSGWLTDEERRILESVDADLGELPSVDTVEVLRCKDCRHWKHGNIRPNYCEVFEWNNEKSDFCSFVERKTDV